MFGALMNPLGYAVQIVSPRADAVEIARELWQDWPHR